MDQRTLQAVYCLADALQGVVRAVRIGVLVHAERMGPWIELLKEADEVCSTCKRHLMGQLAAAEGLALPARHRVCGEVKP